MNEKRLVVAVFGVLLAGVVIYISYRFIAALTVSVFLYYSTRGIYEWLAWLQIPKRIRAVAVLAILGVPLILLISYTVGVLASELRVFVQQYTIFETLAGDTGFVGNAGELPEPTIQGLIETYRAGELNPIIDRALEHAEFVTSLVTGFLLNLLIVVIVTYYLLIDGWRAREWLLQFDDEAIVREYLRAADDELESVLLGNLLNVIIVSVVAMIVYLSYNAYAPAAAEVPYPALAGALTGVASLIPVVGMKIVYVPVAIGAAVPIVLGGDPSMLVYVGGFLVLAIVVVDTIPDLLLRPYLSGEMTHVGLLMLGYIFGPIVFGFYGLFLAPIILVLGLTFAQTALPRLLGTQPNEGIPTEQRQLDEF